MKKLVFILLFLLSSLFLPAQILLDRLKFEGKNYKENLVNKSTLSLNDEVLKRMPTNIRCFKLAKEANYVQENTNCVQLIEKDRAMYKLQCAQKKALFDLREFTDFWEKREIGCFLRFKELLPMVTFYFNNVDKGNYQIFEIEVNIYNQTQKAGPDNSNYLSTKNFGKEVVSIDPKEKKKTYLLTKTYDESANSAFVLQLLFSTLSFNPDDIPTPILMDVTFLFKKGKTFFKVPCDPFLIDVR